MNQRLKESLETAESILPQDGQDELAIVVDMFTANYGQNAQDNFSQEELAEIEKMVQEPFIEADPEKVKALFAKHGV